MGGGERLKKVRRVLVGRDFGVCLGVNVIDSQTKTKGRY